MSEEADPREAQIREMFEKENKAEMNKQSKEHEKWLKKAHKAKAAKDLEIQEKFKVIQPQIVDRLTTHIHEVIIRMFAMSVITSDEKARLEMMDHPSGKAIQLLDYSNYRSNYIPSLLKILDEMNLGAVSDFIRLEIGMPVSAKGTCSLPKRQYLAPNYSKSS